MRKQKQLTEEQIAARDARRERFRALVKDVAALSEESRMKIVDKFGTVPTCEGRPLSLFNTCLLLMQLETVSMVGGFRQWQAAGRQVRKGEHGLMIWIPKKERGEEGAAPKASDADGAEMMFFLGTVFDISQTDAIEQQAAA